ncbi:MAG: hypothetical protein WB676_10760 [Bryobacteraceae bacterium]
MRLTIYSLLLLLLHFQSAFSAPPPVTCPAGTSIGNVDLKVSTIGKPHALPLRTINRLTEGDTIAYAPILRTGEKRSGEVSIVLAPASPESKDQTVMVLDPKPANRPADWKISRKISVVAFVYGPDGLNRTKVRTLLAKNSDLVTQLADYAEKTAQTEALIDTLTSATASSASTSAALQGFASQYGLNVKIDKTQPVDQQAMTLFRTVNPAMETTDPLASESSQSVGETASIATSIAGLFFGSPVGLAAGGAAMVMDLRALAFPRTDFRSSLAEPLPDAGLALCAKTAPPGPHTKIAYLWASRIPNTAAPEITIGKANSIPVAQKSPVPVEVAETDWKYVDRIHDWQLIGEDKKPIAVGVKKLLDEKGLEFDLSKAKVPPGTYKLEAAWDWDRFPIKGELQVQKFGDFSTAHVDPLSQDQLIAGKGKVRAALTGSDFEFVTTVQYQKANDEFAKPEPIPYVLPDGLRRGPQEHLDVLVDTKDLEPGKYEFLLAQVDGHTHPVNFHILPEPPSISNLPIVISGSDNVREVTLKGEHLDLITKLETARGNIVLAPPLPQQNERTATIKVTDTLKPGAAYDIDAFVAGHTEPLVFPEAIHVVGPRPLITSAKLSPPSEMPIPLQPGELAAGVFVSGMLEVKNLANSSAVQLSCEGQEGNVVTVHMGEHTSSANLQQLAAGQVFLSFDTNGWPAGCTIQARIDNGPDGLSGPCRLGRLVRFPRIDSFQVTSSEAATSTYVGELIGTDLQNIEKIGWDGSNGSVVTDLPSPIPGAGMQQSLKVKLPAAEPSPHAPLYIWLRGDQEGRLTTIHD